MIPVSVIFYVFAALAAVSGFFMVLTRNVLYAAFSLLICLLSLAAIYVCLFADLAAIAQLMIYVGGILILILFGLMLSLRKSDASETSPSRNKIKSSLLAGSVLAGMLFLIFNSKLTALPGLEKTQPVLVTQKTSIYSIGIEFMTTFALPFEVASLILLAALVGAAYISAGSKTK
ncbi:NADH-quinone oxidoreductase subunit J [Adhaeribacter terreus]|uniref:NADH-quinone oxidoreductase subunit J n=1 Tax=Adhaeribacter terreus TaxID=529703 RepID=A0ABW0EGE6_9BACT